MSCAGPVCWVTKPGYYMKGSSQSGAEANGWVRLFHSFLYIRDPQFRVFSKTRGKTTYFKLHGKERSRNKDLGSHLEIELGTSPNRSSRNNRPDNYLYNSKPASKRFRLVSEQNGIFGCGRERNRTRANLSFQPPPRSFTRAIFRAIFDSPSSFFASKPHWKACYAGYKTAYLFTWIDRVPLACVQTSPPPSGKNRNRNPDFFLREEGKSVHRLSSVHTKPVNPLTKTASFWNRSLERFQTQFTRTRKKKGGFKNFRIRVDKALEK